MSGIHGLEPQAYGLIIFRTTFGDIEIELFTKQCPKITRNFVKLCLDRFYDKAALHKLEKDFIAIVGEFKAAQNKPQRLPDEIHSRLRFTRRGLVATANTKKDGNGPEFFFTLGPTQELQGKHTIFGRVRGDSLYNLVDLNDCPVDTELRPKVDKIVLSVNVIENPFPDLEKTIPDAAIEDKREVEEESSSSEDESNGLSLNQNKELSFFPDEDDDEGEEEEEEQEKSVMKATKSTKSLTEELDTKPIKRFKEEVNHETAEQVKSTNCKEERLREIKAQIQSIKSQLQRDNNSSKSLKVEDVDSELLEKQEYHRTKKKSKSSTTDKRLREQETIELLKNFKKKLKHMSRDQDEQKHPEKAINNDGVDDTICSAEELAELNQVDGDDWLFHKFDADDNRLKSHHPAGRK